VRGETLRDLARLEADARSKIEAMNAKSDT
jgi:hypothetical protein